MYSQISKACLFVENHLSMLPINKVVMHRFNKAMEATIRKRPGDKWSACASQRTGDRMFGWYKPWSSQIREL
jgi:hypothetical protein